MKRDLRFWRTALLIAAAHAALLIAVLRWTSEARGSNAESITWMDAGSSADPDERVTFEEEAQPAATEGPDNLRSKSDLALPTATPTPPHRLQTPASKKPVSKLPDRSKPRTTAHAAANKSKTPADRPSRKLENRAVTHGGSGPGDSNGSTGGTNGVVAAESNAFGHALYQRLYRAWEQPTSVVATGAKYAALVRLRIEKDGRVSDFRMVQPSGNMLVDQSVQAVAARIDRVDAPPASILRGDHYDVNVNFALNSE